MAKLNLTEIVQHEIKKFLFEKFISELLPVGHPSNLHGDERTQRQYVMDLAAQNPMGLISISDIALALNKTRDEIRDTYARQIRYYEGKEDFDKIIEEVPFQSAAVYQLVARAHSAPLTREQLNKILNSEEQKYDKTTGVYYPIHCWSKDDKAKGIVGSSSIVGYLNLKKNEDVREYVKLLPKQLNYYGNVYFYNIITDKKLNKLPKDAKETIVTPETFDEFVKKEFSQE